MHRITRPRPATLLWALAIAILLLAPSPVGGPETWWFLTLERLQADKLVHLVLFAVQAVLGRRWARAAGLRAPDLWALAATVAYGALTELLQLYVPGRDGDLFDLAADGTGAVLAVVLARWRERSVRRGAA